MNRKSSKPACFELTPEELADEGLTDGRYFWYWRPHRMAADGPFGPYESIKQAEAEIPAEFD